MIRVMDEVVRLGEKGVALFLEEGETPPSPGSLLEDARGQRHEISRVMEQDGLQMLLLRDGDFAYFERLFRDVRVDATAFQLMEG